MGNANDTNRNALREDDEDDARKKERVQSRNSNHEAFDTP